MAKAVPKLRGIVEVENISEPQASAVDNASESRVVGVVIDSWLGMARLQNARNGADDSLRAGPTLAQCIPHILRNEVGQRWLKPCSWRQVIKVPLEITP